MPIIIDHACCSFGTVRALDGVSLEIADGELFFLLGASGCGKTTLLRAIAGFQELQSGTLHFGTQEMTQVPPHRRNTGMMFQGYALWPHLTVAQNVAFGLEERKVPKAERERRVTQALERVRIRDLAGRKPNQLSGGQQQRVALARTLVVEPAVLLLDEPLANLDAKLRVEMRDEIRRLCKESGLTAVYVTHDQKEALSVADRLAVMEKGKLLQVGSPRAVYRQPVNTLVAGFIGEAHFLPGRIAGAASGGVQVESAAGQWIAAADSAAWPAGRTVVIGARPEAWQLLPADSATTLNCVSATVRAATYLGGAVQLDVDVPGWPGGIAALLPNPREWPQPGASIPLAIAPDDLMLLPE